MYRQHYLLKLLEIILCVIMSPTLYTLSSEVQGVGLMERVASSKASSHIFCAPATLSAAGKQNRPQGASWVPVTRLPEPVPPTFGLVSVRAGGQTKR